LILIYPNIVYRESAIYAFDVIMKAESPFLANRRVFAVPSTGMPASVKCDQNGFVYAGCSGGIEVWNSGGMLQAVVEIPGESNALRALIRASIPFIIHHLQPQRQSYVNSLHSKGSASSFHPT
jgi:hypothetical protein